MAVVLAALNGQIRIVGSRGERNIAVTDFFSSMENALEHGEMVREVEVPRISGPVKQAFFKFTLRRPVDFAIVSVASVMTVKEGVCVDARIALGAVAPGPVRAKKAEQFLKGRSIDMVRCRRRLSSLRHTASAKMHTKKSQKLVKRA
jgi:xanthine dehydrogenase YagS FAD-binding subunit